MAPAKHLGLFTFQKSSDIFEIGLHLFFRHRLQMLIELLQGRKVAPVDEAILRNIIEYITSSQVNRDRARGKAVEDLLGDITRHIAAILIAYRKLVLAIYCVLIF